MNSVNKAIFLILFLSVSAFSQQNVSGRIVHNGNGLEGNTVQVFAGDKTAKTMTNSDGTFNISGDLTGVVE